MLSHDYHYPPRHNNRFTLLINGDQYYPAMLNAINNARNFILFESYLFESGQITREFIHALSAASKKGVTVYLMLDDYGALGLSDTDKASIRQSGIHLLLYNKLRFAKIQRYLRRDHRKIIVTDYTEAYIGGAGVTDDFSPEHNDMFWHDTMMKVEGELITDFIDSFITAWNKYNNEVISLAGKAIPPFPEDNTARLLLAQGTEQNEITRAVVKRIRSAKERIWLTSPYFISSIKVRRALRKAARNNIDVRLLFPGQHSDHKWVTYGIHRFYHRLLKSGTKIFEYLPRFTHSKLILVDDWYTIGSSNLDKWNQYLNLDINIEVTDTESCSTIISYFNENFSQSKQVKLEDWKKRSWRQRFIEWILGIAIRILEKISHKYKR